MRILVVDRQPLIHEAIRRVTEGIGERPEVIGAVDGPQARYLAGAEPALDLVIVDIPPERSAEALDFIAALHGEQPRLPVLALGPADDRSRVAAAIAAGASAFVPKSADPTALRTAVALMRRGGGQLAGAHAQPGLLGCAERAAEPAPRGRRPSGRHRFGMSLTRRQAQVLALMAQGVPNKTICRELRLAEGTVKVHVSAVLRALNVTNRTQAALAAARLGVAPIPPP